jgi:hypothetical protein
VPGHPLQRPDALRLEIAPPGKVSRDGVAWWSVDHGAYAGTAPGVRIGRGIVSGVPDLLVLHRGIAHVVEIKTPAGELSDPQQSVAAVLASGGRVGVVRDADEMLGLLDAWGIPRAQRLWLGAAGPRELRPSSPGRGCRSHATAGARVPARSETLKRSLVFSI